MSSLTNSLIPTGTAELLRRIGYEGEFSLTPLSGGANNRVYRVESERPAMVLKSFFHVPDDPRDRFKAEKAFYEFVESTPLSCTPRALAWSETDRLGLFSWVDGRKLVPTEVDASAINQALQFYRSLNEYRALPCAHLMDAGSEACFNLEAHLHCVERRIRRLEKMTAASDLDRAALKLVTESLRPALAEKTRELTGKIHRDTELSLDQRCVSPSDFGFHNSLLGTDGRLIFFDFEYAGWDDPAKFFCDFLCQPALPVPLSLWPLCFETLAQAGPGQIDPERINDLLPVYQLKWCCIILNEFLPKEKERRQFAQASDSVQLREKQQNQLSKAQECFKRFCELKRYC